MAKYMTPAEAAVKLKDFSETMKLTTFPERMRTAAAYAEGIAKANCPADEGMLRMAMASKVENDGGTIRGYVYNSLEYAPFVHQGTGIYAVEGNGRKTPWMWYGDSVKWRGWHWTVGQKPKPFIKDAVEMNVGTLGRLLGGLG